ncbi:MAG: hypothetical protein AAF667_16635 [Pseudomonadota bacterium]
MSIFKRFWLCLPICLAVAACDTDLERGLGGAATGAVVANVAGGSTLTGALIGGAAGVFCDDVGVC